MSAPAPKQAPKAQPPKAEPPKAEPPKAEPPKAIEPSSPLPGSDDKASSENIPIDPEQIAALAYSYWEARGAQGGTAELDWLRAEQELRARR